ncbi:PIR Superfamily Protein [Plasmodium ovale wallikeri]|uniref:PIR Superfamily Protein n=1 Tax=Plasmodium ovale wallikeri TaxID=864142 RepID=A0A1A9AQM5_PLAOA|nr:PIR Superfamily Protein [Plasmodium ovale wallikeri]
MDTSEYKEKYSFLQNTCHLYDLLNSSLFYQIKRDIFTDNIIKKIFSEFESRASEFGYQKNCTYYSYYIDTKEPQNTIKLNNFVDNIKCVPKEETQEVISAKDDNTVEGGITGTFGGTGFSLLALYKFSPFGPILRSRLQSWKRNNNLDGEQELFSDRTGNHNTYPDDGISYTISFAIIYRIII